MKQWFPVGINFLSENSCSYIQLFATLITARYHAAGFEGSRDNFHRRRIKRVKGQNILLYGCGCKVIRL